MRLAVWGHTTPRQTLSHADLYRLQLDEIRLSEELGFDHYWLYEHHLSPSSPMPSPNLMIAAAARETSRIRLGTLMNILPYRHPLLVAEEMAMLDTLSGGRIDCGIGRGIKPVEFRAFGVDQAASRDIFNESIEIMRRVWADEMFDFQGKFFQVRKETALSPPCVQKPHPPFYISAQSDDSLRWAAENDVSYGQLDALIEDCAANQTRYRKWHSAAGHAPAARFFLTREIYVADSDERAMREVRPYLMKHWDLWNRYSQFASSGQMPDSYDAWRKSAPRLHNMKFEEIVERGLVFAGTPDSIVSKIKAHQEKLDIEVLLGVFGFGGMPHDMIARSMKLFASDVMPIIGHKR